MTAEEFKRQATAKMRLIPGATAEEAVVTDEIVGARLTVRGQQYEVNIFRDHHGYDFATREVLRVIDRFADDLAAAARRPS